MSGAVRPRRSVRCSTSELLDETVDIPQDPHRSDVALPKLEERFRGWKKGSSLPPVPAPTNEVKRDVYVVNKEDVNQIKRKKEQKKARD